MFEDEINLTQAEYYMDECFELAKLGLGKTSPNPVCGAIVIDKNGLPAGKGYHKKAGLEHAEVQAIREAGEKTKDGTLIVNLEPCCHYGKTPPCTDLIIKSQIKVVIFSNYDPNPQVFQKSEKNLSNNNIKVISRVLESQGSEVNKFFFKWIKTKLPWISLKQAQTIDGKVANKQIPNEKITNELSQLEVHKIRNQYDAILVGASTVNIDNPELTVRFSEQIKDQRNPIRIVLDSKLLTKPSDKVYKNNSKVILATSTKHSEDKLSKFLEKTGNHVEILELPTFNEDRINLKDLFYKLGKKNILSVLIEAGPTLACEIVLNKLLDEYILFISPKIYGLGGITNFSFENNTNLNIFNDFELFNYKAIGNDRMISYRNKN